MPLQQAHKPSINVLVTSNCSTNEQFNKLIVKTYHKLKKMFTSI